MKIFRLFLVLAAAFCFYQAPAVAAQPAHASVWTPGQYWTNGYSEGTFETLVGIPESPLPSYVGFRSHLTGKMYYVVNEQYGRWLPRYRSGVTYRINCLYSGNLMIVTSVQRAW